MADREGGDGSGITAGRTAPRPSSATLSVVRTAMSRVRPFQTDLRRPAVRRKRPAGGVIPATGQKRLAGLRRAGDHLPVLLIARYVLAENGMAQQDLSVPEFEMGAPPLGLSVAIS